MSYQGAGSGPRTGSASTATLGPAGRIVAAALPTPGAGSAAGAQPSPGAPGQDAPGLDTPAMGSKPHSRLSMHGVMCLGAAAGALFRVALSNSAAGGELCALRRWRNPAPCASCTPAAVCCCHVDVPRVPRSPAAPSCAPAPFLSAVPLQVCARAHVCHPPHYDQAHDHGLSSRGFIGGVFRVLATPGTVHPRWHRHRHRHPRNTQTQPLTLAPALPPPSTASRRDVYKSRQQQPLLMMTAAPRRPTCFPPPRVAHRCMLLAPHATAN